MTACLTEYETAKIWFARSVLAGPSDVRRHLREGVAAEISTAAAQCYQGRRVVITETATA